MPLAPPVTKAVLPLRSCIWSPAFTDGSEPGLVLLVEPVQRRGDRDVAALGLVPAQHLAVGPRVGLRRPVIAVLGAVDLQRLVLGDLDPPVAAAFVRDRAEARRLVDLVAAGALGKVEQPL